MTRARFKYAWVTWRREQLWFPAAFLALFYIITLMMNDAGVRFSLARAYLGFILPLIAGIMAASSVLDDPALELRFATPLPAGRVIAACAARVMLVAACCAVAYQLFLAALRVDLSSLGGFWSVQLDWFMPALSLAALGLFGTLAGAHTMVGAFLAGSVWLVELLMRTWLEQNGPYAYLFMGIVDPDHAALAGNRLAMSIGSLALLFGASLLLRRQERYLR